MFIDQIQTYQSGKGKRKKMNGGEAYSMMEAQYVRRHHRHEIRDDQCTSALVKHIKAPVHLVSFCVFQIFLFFPPFSSPFLVLSASSICSILWPTGWAFDLVFLSPLDLLESSSLFEFYLVVKQHSNLCSRQKFNRKNSTTISWFFRFFSDKHHSFH